MNIGTYQNSLPELPYLGDERYENIFKVYFSNTNDKNYPFYNILKKVVVPDNINEEYLSAISVASNTPWTILSYKLYNTQHLWWIIFLINKPDNIFYAEPGKNYKYIKPEFIQDILNSIKTQLT